MRQLPINLAPLNEHRRIVAKIEELFSELDKGIENLKTAQAQLKVYRQALLKHAFEGKLTAQWRAANPDKLEPAAALLARIQTEREQRYQQQLQQWQATGGSKPKAPKPLQPLTAEELAELPELPEGWAYVRAEEIAGFITKGTTPSKEFLFEGSGEIPFIKVYNLTKTGFLDFSIDPTFVSSETHNGFLARSKVYPGDVLMNIVGPPLGKVSIVPNTYPEWNINQAIAIFRSKIISNKFLAAYLSHETTVRSMMRKSKATAGQFNLTLEICRETLIPLCGTKEQDEIELLIEEKLSEVDQLDLTLTTSLQQAEALRQSILKRAFSGQLVAQDANDEPAAALLARIKSEKAAAMAKPRKPKQAAAEPAPEKSNVIPFPVRIPNISATDLHAGILARAFQHHENAPKYLGYFGHVKAEKIAHMVEAYLGIDLEREPIKDAAGPNDYPHLMKVESRARKANWFDVKKKKDADAYAFSKKHGFDALLLKTMNALGERADEVDALISLLLPLNSRQSEIVATLYAAWNNLLLQGQTPDDEAIVQEARENWHASKLKIERDKFFKGLEWMRLKGLVPTGNGRYVGARIR
jgi:type I restriction enzyme S subunit